MPEQTVSAAAGLDPADLERWRAFAAKHPADFERWRALAEVLAAARAGLTHDELAGYAAARGVTLRDRGLHPGRRVPELRRRAMREVIAEALAAAGPGARVEFPLLALVRAAQQRALALHEARDAQRRAQAGALTAAREAARGRAGWRAALPAILTELQQERVTAGRPPLRPGKLNEAAAKKLKACGFPVEPGTVRHERRRLATRA